MSRRRPKASRPRSCVGKTRHDTREAAEDALHASVRRGVVRWRLHAYQCGNHWHIGHTPRGKR